MAHHCSIEKGRRTQKWSGQEVNLGPLSGQPSVLITELPGLRYPAPNQLEFRSDSSNMLENAVLKDSTAPLVSTRKSASTAGMELKSTQSELHTYNGKAGPGHCSLCSGGQRGSPHFLSGARDFWGTCPSQAWSQQSECHFSHRSTGTLEVALTKQLRGMRYYIFTDVAFSTFTCLHALEAVLKGNAAVA